MINFRLRRGSFLIGIPLCVVVVFSYLTRHYQPDDGLIYLRYIKNFHEGWGLVYNPGEKFNGLTSPLFTYVVLAVSFLIRDLQVATIILSALFLTCAAILGGGLFSTSKWEALFTSIVIGSFGYFYSTFGMETPLFLMLIALSLYLYKIESGYFVIALALLVTTRSEGIFLAIPMAVDYVLKNRKLPDIKLLTIACVIFLLPFIFNFFYYGDFLPATGNAKISQGKSGFWGDKWIFFNIKPLIDDTFSNSNLTVVFFEIFSAFGIFSLFKDRVAIVVVFFSVLLLSFYAGLNIPNYHWYYAPFFYVMLIFTCRGIWKLSAALLSKGGLDDKAFVFWLLCGATIVALNNIVSFKERGLNEVYANVGKWVKNNTPANASIAMVEIGTIGWFSDRKVIDILGLVNKYNADYIGKSDLFGWLNHYQPDYILRHDPSWVFEESIKVLESSGAYAPVSEFQVPGVVLLKKSNKYSDLEITRITQKEVARRASVQATLNDLARTGEAGTPNLFVSQNLLFAHAPSSLNIILKHSTNSITVSYGIKEGAENYHSGVCFEIRREATQEKIMYRCIEALAKREEMYKHESLKFTGNPGEKLTFNTSCKAKCDYAWSYWSEVVFN